MPNVRQGQQQLPGPLTKAVSSPSVGTTASPTGPRGQETPTATGPPAKIAPAADNQGAQEETPSPTRPPTQDERQGETVPTRSKATEQPAKTLATNQPGVRKSARIASSSYKKKTRDEAFISLGDIKIPATFKQAVNDPQDGWEWQQAIESELQSLLAFNTWRLEDLPQDKIWSDPGGSSTLKGTPMVPFDAIKHG